MIYVCMVMPHRLVGKRTAGCKRNGFLPNSNDGLLLVSRDESLVSRDESLVSRDESRLYL